MCSKSGLKPHFIAAAHHPSTIQVVRAFFGEGSSAATRVDPLSNLETTKADRKKPRPPPDHFHPHPHLSAFYVPVENMWVSATRDTHSFPRCPQGKLGTNKCDQMGQTITHPKKPRPAEDFFYLGARMGEYSKPPLIEPSVAGFPASALVPLPDVYDPSVMLQTAGMMAAESKVGGGS